MYAFLRTIGKRWVAILLFVVLLTGIFAALEILVFPKQYRSGVLMYVRVGEDSARYSQMYMDLQASGMIVNDYMTIATSETILTDVVINLRDEYPQINNPYVLSPKTGIQLEAVNQTRMFWVYVTSTSSELSAVVANEIARTMLEKDKEITGFANLYMLANAEPASKATFPNYMRDIPICAGAALLVAIGMALFLDYLKTEKDKFQMEGVVAGKSSNPTNLEGSDPIRREELEKIVEKNQRQKREERDTSPLPTTERRPQVFAEVQEPIAGGQGTLRYQPLTMDGAGRAYQNQAPQQTSFAAQPIVAQGQQQQAPYQHTQSLSQRFPLREVPQARYVPIAPVDET